MSKNKQKQSNFTFEQWTIFCKDKAWFLEAYSLATGKREIIAEIRDNAGFPAEPLARFIADAVNNIDRRECLINEMATALEICLESEDGKLSWSAEHDAEVALRHAKTRTPIKP